MNALTLRALLKHFSLAFQPTETDIMIKINNIFISCENYQL